MSLFGRGRGGPARVTVREAAACTEHGHTPTTSGASSLLLDVREAGEWQAGHAPGAVHLPLTALAAGAGLPAHAPKRPVIVICRSGRRSLKAVELLRARGVEAVDVIGGMQEWAAAGLPVVDALGGNGTVA
ncbi:rhodanese-like domain-containing protein [Streptomyces sp. NPDC050743]|uniref:rhodanese-like domain-containing protein n=1 Tax=Streptomyces sp. NPDC050743 TaxID=3365634 RepID=UPI0037A59454